MRAVSGGGGAVRESLSAVRKNVLIKSGKTVGPDEPQTPAFRAG